MRQSRKRFAGGWRLSASASRSTEWGQSAARISVALGFLATLVVVLAPAAAARSLEGLARVTKAGSLVVSGYEVALAGIDIPTFDRTCRQVLPPFRCGPRAVLILDGKVSGFVHCDIVGERRDGILEGRCTVAGQRLFDARIDLAAELLREGWALASDDAPAHYRALERMARSRQIGLWRDAAVDLR